jgi:hypothetical protein
MTKDEALKKAFKQAFQLGQDYWYQADHEYESQNKKSDVTRAKFEQLMEDAIKEALTESEQEPAGWRPATFHRDNLTFNPGLPDEQTVKFWKLQGVEIEYCYTSPPQRKPLTRQQCLHLDVHPLMTIEQIVCVVEAEHGIKGKQ